MIHDYLERHLTDEQKGFIDYYGKTTKVLLERLDKSVVDGTFSVSLPDISKMNK